MANVQEKTQAIGLRRRGFTYQELWNASRALPRKAPSPIGVCSSITLTPEQLTRIEKRMQVGRDRARFKSIDSL